MKLIGTRTLWSYFFTLEDFSYQSFCLEILRALSRAQMANDDFPELSDAISSIIYHALSVRNPKMPLNTRLVLLVNEILMCTTVEMFEEWKRSHADVDVEFLEYRRREVRDLLSGMCKLMDRETRFSIVVSSLDELVFDFGDSAFSYSYTAFSYSYTASNRLIKWVGLRVLNSGETENILRHLKEQVDRSDWSAEEISTFDWIIGFFFSNREWTPALSGEDYSDNQTWSQTVSARIRGLSDPYYVGWCNALRSSRSIERGEDCTRSCWPRVRCVRGAFSRGAQPPQAHVI